MPIQDKDTFESTIPSNNVIQGNVIIRPVTDVGTDGGGDSSDYGSTVDKEKTVYPCHLDDTFSSDLYIENVDENETTKYKYACIPLGCYARTTDSFTGSTTSFRCINSSDVSTFLYNNPSQYFNDAIIDLSSSLSLPDVSDKTHCYLFDGRYFPKFYNKGKQTNLDNDYGNTSYTDKKTIRIERTYAGGKYSDTQFNIIDSNGGTVSFSINNGISRYLYINVVAGGGAGCGSHGISGGAGGGGGAFAILRLDLKALVSKNFLGYSIHLGSKGQGRSGSGDSHYGTNAADTTVLLFKAQTPGAPSDTDELIRLGGGKRGGEQQGGKGGEVTLGNLAYKDNDGNLLAVLLASVAGGSGGDRGWSGDSVTTPKVRFLNSSMFIDSPSWLINEETKYTAGISHGGGDTEFGGGGGASGGGNGGSGGLRQSSGYYGTNGSGGGGGSYVLGKWRKGGDGGQAKVRIIQFAELK